MSRIDRVNELSGPPKGPQGAGRDQKNLDQWANRAEKNSLVSSQPSKGASTDTGARAAAKKDLNHDGNDFMKNVRREA